MPGLLKFLGTAARASLGGGTVPTIAVAVVIALCALSYTRGTSHARADCKTAALELHVARQADALANLERQLEEAKSAREAAIRRAQEDATTLQEVMEKADAFKQEISGRVDRCILSDDDADGLSRIGN